VGYAGGTKKSPTYETIGDQVECVEVLFDPKVVTYDELLAVFWKSHDPTNRPYANQYTSLILASDTAQAAAAKASAKRYEKATGNRVLTRIDKLTRFYPAEDYHQKYYLRQDRVLAKEFRAIFGDDQEALRDSTSAARVNGYIAGYGENISAGEGLDSLGLSGKGRAYLVSKIDEGAFAGACAIVSP